MDEKRIKEAFERLNPTQEQKDRLRLLISEQQRTTPRRENRRFRNLGAVAAAVVVVVACGVGINAMSGGAVAKTLRQVFSISQGRQDVAGQAEGIKDRGIEVYAPEIISVDKEQLIFATKRGVLLVDRRDNHLINAIDLQKTGNIYLNSDAGGMQTHILKQDGDLVIFNSDETIEGPCWRYALSDADKKDWEPVRDDDKKDAESFYQAWKKADANYADTFDQYEKTGLGSDRIDPNDDIMYSERCVQWTDGKGNAKSSYLLVDTSGKYTLVTHDMKSGKVQEEALNLNISEVMQADTTEVSLPEFAYSGKDPALNALISYMRDENRKYFEENEVWIPSILVLRRIENENEVLLFGFFNEDTYKQNGKILEAASGARTPGYAKIAKKKDGYEVTKLEYVGDGDDYATDIARFTEGYPGLYEQYFEERSKAEQESRLESLKMYVEDNHLDITHYQDYGWQPVEIK